MNAERLAISAALAVLLALGNGAVRAQSVDALQLIAKIPLGPIVGRIDHLAVDLHRQRLYVAELGNNSVGVVDLKSRVSTRTIGGFAEPQGLGYVETTDTLYVADASDGVVHVLQGEDLSEVAQISLEADADNIRVDTAGLRVFVGYARGGLAVIDVASHAVVSSIRLAGHPEGFQLAQDGSRIFVDVPDSSEVAVIDRATNTQVGSWSTDKLHANFPLAIDEAHQRVLVAFRSPPALGVFDLQSGVLTATSPACADADDVLVDRRRDRIYVICGSGQISVWTWKGNAYQAIGQVPTSPGARTGLYAPELDLLFVAVRATHEEPAAIWVFRPAPLEADKWLPELDSNQRPTH